MGGWPKIEYEYRGWRFQVLVLPSDSQPDSWRFTVKLQKDNFETSRGDYRNYSTMNQAEEQGEQYAREWIDKLGGKM